jgi:hypothetical protein
VAKRCHYCPRPATTKDHIVPRVLVKIRIAQTGPVDQRVHSRNQVPACEDCNGTKDRFRSDCNCNKCTQAWNNLGPLNPDGSLREIKVVALCNQQLNGSTNNHPVVLQEEESRLDPA